MSEALERARAEGFAAGDYEGRRRLVYALTDCGRLGPAQYRFWAKAHRERLGYRGSELETQLERLATLVEVVHDVDMVPDAWKRWKRELAHTMAKEKAEA